MVGDGAKLHRGQRGWRVGSIALPCRTTGSIMCELINEEMMGEGGLTLITL